MTLLDYTIKYIDQMMKGDEQPFGSDDQPNNDYSLLLEEARSQHDRIESLEALIDDYGYCVPSSMILEQLKDRLCAMDCWEVAEMDNDDLFGWIETTMEDRYGTMD